MAEEEKQQKKPARRGPHGWLTQPVEKATDRKGTVKRLVKLLSPQAPKLVIVFICAVLATLFDVLAPRQLGFATTTIFNGSLDIMKGVPGAHIDFATLQMILASVVVLYLAYGVFTYLQTFIMARVAQNLVYKMREQAEAKIERLPLSYFDSHSKGDIISRIVNDIDLISATLQESITTLIQAVITLVGVLVMMLLISPIMTLIAIVTLPISIAVTVLVAKQSQRFYLAQQTSLGELDGHIEETYGGHTEVKAFTHEAGAVADFERINSEYFKHAWHAQFMSGIIRPIMGLVGNFGYIAVCVVGAWQVLAGNIFVGDIQAFTQYMRNFTRPITQIASIINTIQATIAGAERVFQFLDESEMEQDAPASKAASPAAGGAARACAGRVEFDHVRFGYDPSKPVIHDLSVSVEPGQTVAIVGPTGAGKTTLVNLLMRFYEIDAGSIRLDGVDIRDMSRSELRSHFGMVLQDTWLFNGTIRENIAYGVDHASEDDIVRASKAALSDHFIRTLPDGYDTVINEEATNISTGQRQLLTIARALLANPQILILDEATSSIDTRTERLVQDAMNRLMANRTSFVIAHRLSTIRDADVILVLNDGDIVEQGMHEELLNANGFYADLYNSQFSG